MDTLQRAEAISTELRGYKALEKAYKELDRLASGRGSIALELLDIQKPQLDRAITTALDEMGRHTTNMNHLLKGGEL